MIEKLTQILGFRITSESRDLSIGSIIMYAGGIGIFTLSILKMGKLHLTETQLFFGLLLVVCVMMQMVVGGMLLGVLGRISSVQKAN